MAFAEEKKHRLGALIFFVVLLWLFNCWFFLFIMY